MVKIRYK